MKNDKLYNLANLENNIYYLQQLSKCDELDVKDITREVVKSLELIYSILKKMNKKDDCE